MIKLQVRSNFTYLTGRYKFDFKKLGEAHEYCQKEAEAAIAQQKPLVIINNTNVKFWEYKKYLHLAKNSHYATLILEPRTPWARNPDVLALKSQHGVPKEILEKKVRGSSNM